MILKLGTLGMLLVNKNKLEYLWVNYKFLSTYGLITVN